MAKKKKRKEKSLDTREQGFIVDHFSYLIDLKQLLQTLQMICCTTANLSSKMALFSRDRYLLFNPFIHLRCTYLKNHCPTSLWQVLTSTCQDPYWTCSRWPSQSKSMGLLVTRNEKLLLLLCLNVESPCALLLLASCCFFQFIIER